MATSPNRSSRLPDIKEIEVDRNPFSDPENEQSRLMRQPLMPVAEGLNKEDIRLEQSQYDVSVELRQAEERKPSSEQVDPDEYCVILNKRDSAFVTILKIVAMIVLSPIWIPLVFLKLIWELLKLAVWGMKKSHEKKHLQRFFSWVGRVWIIPFFKGFGHTFRGGYLLVKALVVTPIIWGFTKIFIPITLFWLDHMGKGIVYSLIGLYKISAFVFMIIAFISAHFAIGIKHTSMTTWRMAYFVFVNFCSGFGHTFLTIGRGLRFLSVEFGKGTWHTLWTAWTISAFLVVENAKGIYHTASSLCKGTVFVYMKFEQGCYHSGRALYHAIRFTIEQNAAGIYHTTRSLYRFAKFIVLENCTGIYHSAKSSYTILKFIVFENASGTFHSFRSIFKGLGFVAEHNGKGIIHTIWALWKWAREFWAGLRHTGKILIIAVVGSAIFLGKKIVGRALTDIGKFLTIYFYRYILKPLWTVVQKVSIFIFIWFIKPVALAFYKVFLAIKKVVVAVLTFLWKYLKIALLFIGGIIKKCCLAVGKVIGKCCMAIGRGLKCVGKAIGKVFSFIGGILKKIFTAIGKFFALIGRGVAQCFKAIGKIFKKK